MKLREEELGDRLAGFLALDTEALRQQWTLLFKSAPSSRISRDVLIRAVAWAMQAEHSGGLSKTARRQLTRYTDELASSGSVTSAPSTEHKAGTRLIREWQGKVHEVIVLDDAYLWSGTRYSSLSAIARAITGTRWSGPRFFGIETGSAKPTS